MSEKPNLSDPQGFPLCKMHHGWAYNGVCPLCRLEQQCAQLRAERDDARRRLGQAAGALAEFGEHGEKCPLSLWEAGEPRADGYYHKYAGVWYAPGERPECECGLGAAIAAAAGAQP